MSLRDFIAMNVTTGPVTREQLDASFEQVRDYVPPLPHYCDRDGHIALFGSTRCAQCGEPFRTRTVDENHVLLGEFWP